MTGHETSNFWVGRSITRFEDAPLVRGQGTFTGDLKAARYARFVRSSVAAGVIKKIRSPAGTTVITADDMADVRPIQLVLYNFDYQPVDQYVLARGAVRFVGEPIAVVLAATAEEAEDIADRVEVEIEEIPAIVEARDAVKPDAPRVHPHLGSNIVVNGHFKSPNFDSASVGLRKVKAKVRSRRHAAFPLETRNANAAFDRITGRVTLTCTTQSPHLFRTIIADLVGMPESDLRVVAPDVGGGFGQKATLPPEFVVVTWLARRFRTSVAWIEDRRENLIAGFHARDGELEVEGMFDEAGKLVALSGDVLINVGAYSSFPTSFAVEPLMAMSELTGIYDISHYRCVSRGVVTNTCPMAPYRGVARPMIVFVMERLMDRAAREFGMEPVELRRRNLIGSFPHSSPTGLVYDEASYQETLEMAVKAVDLPAFRAQKEEARRQGRYLGIGFSTFSERTGYGTPAFGARKMQFTMGWERADIAIDPSGFVEVRVGASPHGQGLRTTLAQIVADQIALAPNRIKIIHGDTDATPYGWGTFASRSLVITGGACMLAAQKMARKLRHMAGHLLEASPDDIVLQDGFATVAGTDRSTSVSELARAAYHRLPLFAGTIEPGLNESAIYDPYGTFSNACHAAIVEVDIETGGVKIDRYIVMEDAGRLINPAIVDGQIHGGVAQGIANALLEEIVYDETGNVLTATLADFLPPTSLDIPSIEIGHRETLTSATVHQAKGLGEGGAIGPPAAIINAINDAIVSFGAEINEIPASPRRIYSALKAAGAFKHE